ncbi:MAG: GNAT family N-acetyltransferase [Spirochaetaceae bacterium]|jgi:GNAT superfamily N-acetyltransferase|nr:GNAT family N-acetyltransferase [Spirochaetaceae bacterium]
MDTQASARKAVLTDLPYYYEICLKTGNAGMDASSLFFDPFMLGHYFAAPFLRYENGIAFTLDFDGRPSGYSIAAPDTAAYNRWLEEAHLPELRLRYPLPCPAHKIHSPFEEQMYALFHKPHFPFVFAGEQWYGAYPASLHINLLPAAQGFGLGRLLMDTLCKELSGRGIPGVHLGVDTKNTAARAFYQKMEFTPLFEKDGCLFMGKHLL